MQGILKVNKLIDKTGLEYESYLQNMGRQLFYKVAASYTTIYLALIFYNHYPLCGRIYLYYCSNENKRQANIKAYGH